MTPEPFIAGRIPARRLLAALATSRPRLHAEADSHSQIKAVSARLGTLWENHLPGGPGSDEGAL